MIKEEEKTLPNDEPYMQEYVPTRSTIQEDKYKKEEDLHKNLIKILLEN